MRTFLSLLLALCIALGLAQSVQAEPLIGLKPCSEVPAFQALMNERLSSLEEKILNASPAMAPVYQQKLAQTSKRFERYSKLLCGEEGLPHLVTDGRLNHAGEFLIPGLLFLYIAGWLGWAGRSYLIAVRDEDSPEMKESLIDVPLALRCFLTALAWPAAAFKEIASGEIREPEAAVPISPR
ncbi:Photosystem I reaction center subunit III [Synechococcus sp. R55.6]|jgi:Photosystem I reaction centre subunit III.|uniref:Photosystem I reaction center subunit III n=1 Tax=unclassified Synechococcus TaxID=2626047 RepID=UPI0017A91D4F|nr:Photosystem I reaction center subunit III [Cyanobacteriota bacterium PSP.bin.10]HIK20164.1 Photosystem I reaction center subunit III [Synechococcus sp. M44_DOE_062]